MILFLAGTVSGWIRTYEYAGAGFSVDQTTDGGYVVTGLGWQEGSGIAVELLLLKADSSGNEEWRRYYTGEYGAEGHCVRQTSDGGYIVVGETFVPMGYVDLWLLKTDANGDTMWTRVYGGEGLIDVGYWVEQTADGGYIITGYYEEAYLWILKTNTLGDTLWTRYYNFLGPTGCFVQEVPGGYIVSGSKGLIRTDADGDTLWTYYFEGGGVCSACEASDGGYVFTAATWGSFGALDIFLIKVDAEGDSVWGQTWGGDEEDESYCVQQTTDGGYIVVGKTNSFGAGGYNVWLLKTDANGDTLWSRILPGKGYSVEQTKDTGYIIAGYEAGYLLLIKTDSLGYAGVEEPVTPATYPDWQIPVSVGRHIALQYENRPQGFHAYIYDAAGRKVDEVRCSAASGTITWGEGASPGVYFIKPVSEKAPQKVVLVR